MIIFDFLIYNLTNWYIARRDGLKWSTSLERAVYATGIILMLWLFDIWLIINVFLLKNVTLKESSMPFIVLGITIMIILNYIYIKKGRFERVSQAENTPFNINDKYGQGITIGLTFLPLVIFCILLLLT